MIKKQHRKTDREKDRWKLREPESEIEWKRNTERERNAESSRPRIIKSERDKNTKHRPRVLESAK